jgi:hypothetical protein
MNTQSLPNLATSSASTRLHGGWLLFGRLLWLALVLIAVALFIAGIPFRADDLREQYQAKIGAFFFLNGGIILPFKQASWKVIFCLR